ncbi:cadherin-like protein 26 [Hemicordylus capensis]|uniref:cadherin-like protein 26 n=1 Tax=Hemicordylus capensis TaxID=884348 RepID=UPI0023027155|nr:cadherin-like protein 26 [Hemicordylus capensis]
MLAAARGAFFFPAAAAFWCLRRVSLAALLLAVLDLNVQGSLHPLQRTKRRWVITTLDLQEESKGPFPMLVGELFNDATLDLSVKYLIHGPGVDQYPEIGLFSIKDDANGSVYVHRSIDRERTPFFLIRFDVANRMTGEIVDRSLFFNIEVRDINDNAPEFLKKEFNISMKENHDRSEPNFNVTASDKDKEGTENSRVTYSLVLQTPRPKEPVFTVDSSSGQIRISGCSDYEAIKRFTLLIKAVDHGSPQLSSTATVNIAMEDSNNNIPVFTQENYHLDVPEGEMEHDVLRLAVEDQDSRNTSAWRAKYKIVRGNEKHNFIIETDPDSNEGVLSIVKPLTYHGISERKLVISVENEEPMFICSRGQMMSSPGPPRETSVKINVIDRNDAPQFNPPVLILRQEEELDPGTRLVQYTARDLDSSHLIRYKVASDPYGWVTVNESSGVVTTMKKLDREAPYLNSSAYTIVIHAIDNGVPPLTGTGTIQLHLIDINDNEPMLITPSLEVCDGKGKGPFIIKAKDKDSHPYAEPFTFQLDGDSDNTKNSWKLGENFGDSVELFMLRSLPLGHYVLPIQILDKQGFSKTQTLDVRVCHCRDGIMCAQELRAASIGLGGNAVAAVMVAILLLILSIGLLLWCSCRSETEKGPGYIPYEMGNQSLIHYNEESQQHGLPQDAPDGGNHKVRPPVYAHISKGKALPQGVLDVHEMIQAKPTGDDNYTNGMRILPQDHQLIQNQVTLHPPTNSIQWKKPHDRIMEAVNKTLNKKWYQMINMEDNIASHSPHVYAEEGELENCESFLSLPVADDDNSSLPPDFLDILGPRFATLEKICSK